MAAAVVVVVVWCVLLVIFLVCFGGNCLLACLLRTADIGWEPPLQYDEFGHSSE